MSGTKATIASVFDRLQSRDKDFRYMATSDLIELLKDPVAWKHDTETERRLCDQIVAQLDDSSSDVSSLAVKCLGYLVQRVQPDKADKILDTLCTRLVSGRKEADRESASISLKTTVLDLPGETAKSILRHVVPKLLQGSQTKEPTDVAAASLDIMNDILLKFGHLLGSEQAQLKDILLQGLVDSKPVIRKRAVSCLGSLVPHLPDSALEQVATHIMQGLKASQGNEEALRIWSQALGAMGRSAGWRFGPYVGQAIPLMVEAWRRAPEEDDDLRELSLAALEGFVLRCPQASRGHLDAILDMVQASLSYDPNYADDMEEDEDEDGEEDEDEMSDEQYSGDDDASWKVRRGAAKLLAAVYTNYAGDLDALYPKTVPSLLSRFREREENVKADVFAAFIALLQQATVRARRDKAPGVIDLLLADAPGILKASQKQLREKSLKTRTGVLVLLKELLATLPDGQMQDVDQLLPGVISAMNDHSSNSSQLRIQALQFLGVALKSSSPAVWQGHVKSMTHPIIAAAGERYSMVSAEGLRVCESLVYIMRPDLSKPMPASHKASAGEVLKAVRVRLTAQDLDQEVKECAVSCAAALVAQLGDALQADYTSLMQGLLDKLQSDTTRLAAVKAFGRIAESPLPLDMAPVLDRLLSELTSYLRKSNRLLRQAALAAIEAVTARQGAALSAERMTPAVDEVANLVNDSDLLVTPLALRFCLKLLPQQPQNADQIASTFLPAALQLVKSPLLQGTALDEVLAFFPAMLAAGSPSATFDSMLPALLAAGNAPDTGKTAQHNIARCIASLTGRTSQQQANAVVKGLLLQLQTGNSTWAAQGENRGRKRAASQETSPGADSVRRLALLSIGEIGRRAELSGFPQLQQTLTSALAGSSEDIKAAASLALGGIAIGDLDTHLPFIIRQIREQAKNPKDQYLLLKALNEVIVSLSTGLTGKQLQTGHQQEVLALLLNSCEGEEECRNVVAECMGHLALLNPTQVLPEVLKLHTSSSPGQRSVVVTAVKVATVPQPHPIDDVLRPAMLPLLQIISDPDRGVRKAAVQMLSSAAHSKAPLVSGQLPAVLPQLFQQTVIDVSLIRTVDLGPFKHKIDDGLELRKAAFECMDVLLDACADRLDYQAFLEHLESGLKDHYDVKLPCHLLLAKLAAAAPGQLLASLHRLTEPLEKTLQTKVKTDAVKQEVDRNEDMIRSALRAVDAISRIPNVDACVPFKQLMQNVVLQEPMAKKFGMVRNERAEAEGAFSL